jgi:hypothetical protein
MTPQQHPKSGWNSVAEYQISSLPYATSSTAGSSAPYYLGFPYVTSFIFIKNTGTNYLNVGFTQNGVIGGQKFSIPPSGSYGDRFRIKDLYLMANSGSTNFEVIAGLTFIETNKMPVLTASAAPGVASPYSDLNTFGWATGLG